jgi:protein HIRA/HIR1
VRIWSTEAILHSANPEFTKPKQLAAISHHSGTIHAVRFSSTGKYLASGADDKIVCVYALDPNPASHTTFGGSYPVSYASRQQLTVDNRVQRSAAC